MILVKSEISVLQRKCKENYLCAVHADKAGYNNSAISRFYYCCFLLSKRCAYEREWLTDKDFEEKTKGSHQLIEERFVNRQIGDPSVSVVDIARLKHFTSIKKHRISAEYSSTEDYTSTICKAEYESCRSMAKNFIEAIENIYKIQIIEEPCDV